MIALPDQSAVSCGERRILHKGLIYELIKIRKLIHLLIDLPDQLGVKAGDLLPDIRQQAKRLLKGKEIPRVCGLIADSP